MRKGQAMNTRLKVIMMGMVVIASMSVACVAGATCVRRTITGGVEIIASNGSGANWSCKTETKCSKPGGAMTLRVGGDENARARYQCTDSQGKEANLYCQPGEFGNGYQCAQPVNADLPNGLCYVDASNLLPGTPAARAACYYDPAP